MPHGDEETRSIHSQIKRVLFKSIGFSLGRVFTKLLLKLYSEKQLFLHSCFLLIYQHFLAFYFKKNSVFTPGFTHK